MRTVDAEEVLNAISRYAREDGYINMHIGTIDSIISNVPTVKRPHGEWRIWYACPYCGEMRRKPFDTCSYCGSDMRKREGEAESEKRT